MGMHGKGRLHFGSETKQRAFLASKESCDFLMMIVTHENDKCNVFSQTDTLGTVGNN